MDTITPAPWELTGDAYVMFFKFPKSFLMEHGFLSEYNQERFIGGGAGCIIIANYKTSPVGPYQELLFLPGKVNSAGRKRYTISKAYTSTEASMESGRKNWGIPKEKADFRITEAGKDTLSIQVSQGDTEILDITTQASGMAFPVNTWFFPAKLIQHYNDKNYLFKIRAKGMGRFAQNLKVDVNPDMYPHFAFFKHVSVMKIGNLKLYLPEARVLDKK